VLDGVEQELPKEILSDWLKEVKILFADASIAQMAFATTPEHSGVAVK